jgi:hypothetical protein
MSSLSLSTAIHVLPCPNCRQTINTSMRECPFCSTAIDHSAAEADAEAFSKVNQAISDASYLKIMGVTAGAFFLMRFVMFISLIGAVGFWFLEVAIPFMSIRWWIKYASIKTDDLEFSRARGTALLVGIGSVIFLILVIAWTIFTWPR